MANQVVRVAISALPGVLVVYLSLNAGGYYPDAQGWVASVMLILLALWLAFAPRPLAGLSRMLGTAIAALAAYAVLSYASGSWSNSDSRALLEFNLVLVYLSALVLFGLTLRSSEDHQRAIWSTLAGIVIVSVIGLATRLIPDVWQVAPSIADFRLSYPLTYWNALGVLAAIGLVLAFGCASRPDGPHTLRVIAAGSIPVLATTIYFTFSRGAIIAALIGVLVYLLVVRPRGAIPALLASVPPTVGCLIVAYHADLLATTDARTEAAAAQGHDVAAAVVGAAVAAVYLRVALLWLDKRLAARTRRASRRTIALVCAGTVAAAVVAGVALGAPSWIGDQVDRLGSDETVTDTGDFRTRLTATSANGRFRLWHVAVSDFDQDPALGKGAGTYALSWDQERPSRFVVANAHSLYLETLAETGAVGMALLGGFLVLIAVGVARRTRGEHRALYGTVLGALAVWFFHAGVDWDWEMPAVTLWVFALGGACLAREHDEALRPLLTGEWSRALATVSVLLLAAVPYQVFRADSALREADDAFAASDCDAAAAAANRALTAYGSRPDPYEILGYCAIRERKHVEAIDDFRAAIQLDPENWDYHYGLALARAAAGMDASAEAEHARRLNPLGPLPRQAARRLSGPSTPASRSWARRLVSRLEDV
jgi:O-antigen ligase